VKVLVQPAATYKSQMQHQDSSQMPFSWIPRLSTAFSLLSENRGLGWRGRRKDGREGEDDEGFWRNRDIKQLVPLLNTLIIGHNFLSSVSHAENDFYPLADIRVCETGR